MKKDDRIKKATLFEKDGKKAVILPNDFCLNGNEVYIKTIGKSLVITGREDAFNEFIEGVNGFSDDFMKDGRVQ